VSKQDDPSRPKNSRKHAFLESKTAASRIARAGKSLKTSIPTFGPFTRAGHFRGSKLPIFQQQQTNA
jgi:hypothetical protein